MRSAHEPPGLYLLVMLGLSLFALGLFGITVLLPVDPETHRLLSIADFSICVCFFADFAYSLARTPNRRKYFFTWGWLDLISSVPAIDALRIGRVGRILRIMRLLRAVRSAKALTQFILHRRSDGALLAAGLLTIILIVTASLAILHFETDSASNIKTAEDALWWAVVTITTIGYGDRFPVTTEGRLVAVGLMIAGVGLFGIFSGFVASWFLQPREDEEALEISRLRAEVSRLRGALEATSHRRGERCEIAEPE